MPSTCSPAPARWAWKPSAAAPSQRPSSNNTIPRPRPSASLPPTWASRPRRNSSSPTRFLWFHRRPQLPAGAWLVFCSPPYDFYVDRREEMLELIGGVLAAAPPESLFVVECDARFDLAQLPDADAWDIRATRRRWWQCSRLSAGDSGDLRKKGGGRRAEGGRRQGGTVPIFGQRRVASARKWDCPPLVGTEIGKVQTWGGEAEGITAERL